MKSTAIQFGHCGSHGVLILPSTFPAGFHHVTELYPSSYQIQLLFLKGIGTNLIDKSEKLNKLIQSIFCILE